MIKWVTVVLVVSLIAQVRAVEISTQLNVPAQWLNNDSLQNRVPACSSLLAGQSTTLTAGISADGNDPKHANVILAPNEAKKGYATWDLGPDPKQERELLSMAIWISGKDGNRHCWSGYWRVSNDDVNYRSITEELPPNPLQHNGRYNVVKFQLKPGEVKGFRYLQYVDVKPLLGHGYHPQIAHIDAQVSNANSETVEYYRDSLPLTAGQWTNPVSVSVECNAQSSLFGWAVHSNHTPFFFGKDAKLTYGEMGGYWQVEKWINLARQSGAGWIRDPYYSTNHSQKDDQGNMVLNVNRIKRSASILKIYRKNGLKVILCPLLTEKNLPDFMHVLDEVDGNVDMIEMHNEPNVGFWGGGLNDYDGYVKCCQALYQMVKSKYPQIKIIVGSVNMFGVDHSVGKNWEQEVIKNPNNPYGTKDEWGMGWMEQILKRGVLNFCDGVSAHPYQYSNDPPEIANRWISDLRGSESFDRWIENWYGLVERYNTTGKKLLYIISETGYAGEGFPQANRNSRLMALFLNQAIRHRKLNAITWYDLKNDGTDKHFESHFGALSYDLKPKIWYDHYRTLNSMFPNPFSMTLWDTTIELEIQSPAVKKMSWKDSNGVCYVLFWQMPKLIGSYYHAGKTLEAYQTQIRITSEEKWSKIDLVTLGTIIQKQEFISSSHIDGKVLVLPITVDQSVRVLVLRP